MNKKGFTLVELLAVVIIIGILLILTIAVVNKQVKKADYKAAKVNADLYIKEVNCYFLSVIIDKDGIVDVDDCSLVTRLINPILDAADPIDGSYILDVCSMEKGD